MNILIDTHILVWLLEGNSKLSNYHQSIIEDLNNQIFVSQFSFIETTIKLKLNKFPDFKITIDEFIEETIKSGIQILPVSSELFQTYLDLPFFENHRDPFDRFIIATAIKEKLELISEDSKFMLYSKVVNLL